MKRKPGGSFEPPGFWVSPSQKFLPLPRCARYSAGETW